MVVEEPQSALVELGGGDPFDHRLPQVVKAPEPPRPTVVAIGEALLIGKARARPLIDQVAEAGLAVRTVGRLDPRRREVVLSDRGRVVLAEARRLRLDHLHQSWRTGTTRMLGALAALLGALVAAYVANRPCNLPSRFLVSRAMRFRRGRRPSG